MTGVIAFYTSFAVVLGSTAHRELLPLGDRHLYGISERGRYQSAANLINSKGGEVGPVETSTPTKPEA